MTKGTDIDFIFLDDFVCVIFAEDRGGLAGFLGGVVIVKAGGRGFCKFLGWVG